MTQAFLQTILKPKNILWFYTLIFTASCSTTSYPTSPIYFSWPVKTGKISRGFKTASRRHDGLDIAAPKNTPIYASAPGRVIYTGRDFSGYGKLLIIEHQGSTWATFYAHLNGFKVKEGQWVQRGQKIALMGRTGRATGNHLHFEIRYKRQPMDPLFYLSSKDSRIGRP